MKKSRPKTPIFHKNDDFDDFDENGDFLIHVDFTWHVQTYYLGLNHKNIF